VFKTRQAIHFIKTNFKGNLVGAEIGIETGTHAQNILEVLNIKTLYLIDIELHPSLVKCIEQFKNKTKILIVSSAEASNMVNEKLDFVYIDANHRYAPLLQDIYCWYPKIRIGGVLCGHDYQIQPVKEAVDEFGKSMGASVYSLENGTEPNHEKDWWILKRRKI